MRSEVCAGVGQRLGIASRTDMSVTLSMTNKSVLDIGTELSGLLCLYYRILCLTSLEQNNIQSRNKLQDNHASIGSLSSLNSSSYRQISFSLVFE